MRSILRIVSLLFAACSSLSRADVWVADDVALYKLDPSGSRIASTVPAQGIRALALDPRDAALWTLSDKDLARRLASGAQSYTATLESLTAGGSTRIALDPRDGSLWIGEGRDATGAGRFIRHVDSNGVLRGSIASPGTVAGLAVALDGSLWLLGGRSLLHYSPQGALLSEIDLGAMVTGGPRLLLVDSLGAWVWASAESRLLRIDADSPSAARLSLDVAKNVDALAVDEARGTVWVLAGKSLIAYDAAGAVAKTVDLEAVGAKNANTLAFDPRSRSLLVGYDNGVARLDAGGGNAQLVPTTHKVTAIGVEPFTIDTQLSLVSPAAGTLTNDPLTPVVLQLSVTCSGSPCALGSAFYQAYRWSVELDAQAIGSRFTVDAAGKATYVPAPPLGEGVHSLRARATDPFGVDTNEVASAFTVDTVPPAFVQLQPAAASITNRTPARITGRLSEPATLKINGTSVPVAADGTFSHDAALAEGLNSLVLIATDLAGNSAQRPLSIRLDTVAPAAVAPSSVSIAAGSAAETFSVTGAAGAVEAGATVRITNARTGEAVQVVASADGSFAAVVNGRGGDPLSVKVVDAAGNESAAATLAIPGSQVPLPPDPATVATPILPTAPTLLAASTAFLYTGPSPIQTGVAAGTIDARRVAVVRGKVTDRSGAAFPGVRVRVLNHPELGQTLSRADGMFDLAVNGGGLLTLVYEKDGALPAQARVQAPWQDFVTAPDVAMVALDSRVTAVQLGGTVLQVARGNPVTDADGARQATLMFKPGTTATMKMADGSTRAMAALNVRATEYTVGPNGRKAMPGPLPPTSAYTYAVELSADEAIAAGAKQVTFSQPVPLYVDNFIGFPVGGIVPAGYYDRDLAAWVPSENGRVIRVLSIADGKAVLDVKGDGTPADAAALAALGVTDGEREQLALLYAPGKTLWRVPIPHFTPWDCNWPYSPPLDATGPEGKDDDGNETDVEQEKECDPCEQGGSVIEAENQVLGEKIAIAGTPFTLNYRSNRVAGYAPNRTIRIPLSNSTLPASVKRIELTIDVAGRQYAQSFSPSPRQTYRYAWDGKDAYGRGIAGATPATVSIRYVYDMVYQSPLDFARAFARLSGVPMTAVRGRIEFTTNYTRQVILNRGGPAQGADGSSTLQGLGGWTFDVNHSHGGQAGGTSLMLGDGSSREVQGRFMTSAAPQVLSTGGLGVDPAGNVFVSGYYAYGISKMGVDGSIGNYKPLGINYGAFGADGLGNLYATPTFFSKRAIQRIAPDGTETFIAGSLFGALSGPGTGPALQAVIRPEQLVVDRDGTLYFTEQTAVESNFFVQRCWLKKLTPDGMISVVAGNGTCAIGGDGGPAPQATLGRPGGLALDSQGNLYVAESATVRRIGVDGIIRTVAGTPASFECLAPFGTADGTPALQACLGIVRAIAVDKSDRLLIASDDTFAGRRATRVRRVGSDGRIETIAGPGAPACVQGNGIPSDQVGPAQAVCPNEFFNALSVNTNGDVLAGMGAKVAIIGTRETRWAGLQGQSLGDGEQRIASRDGSQAYIFDVIGKHVRTVDTRTNALLYRFAHDASGRLMSIEDTHGNVTTIERDAAGKPTAIVGSYGHRTTLTVDANGYLASVANPKGETHRLVHTSGGLLTRFETPKGAASTFEYDELGRLKRDANAAGGFWQLVRNVLGTSGFEVALTTAEGRTTRNRVETLADKSKRRTTFSPDGTQATSLVAEDGGTTTATSADGTVTSWTEGPDPRFGMQAPLQSSATVRFPSGLTSSVTQAVTATLASPANPLSLVRESSTTIVNGRTFASVFDAATRKFTKTSPEGRVGAITVDTRGRPSLVELNGVFAKSYGYDARGRLETLAQGTGPERRSWTMAYGADGYVQSITNALTQQIIYQRNAAGRITQATLPGGRAVAIGYDANGNLTSITPPDRPAHAFRYNGVDLREEEEPPRAGMPVSKTQYKYNLDRQLTTVIRPDGTSLALGYDAGGRRKAITPSAGAGNALAFGYDASTGLLASIGTAGVSLEYAYDGNLPKRETISGVVSGAVGGTYDANFRVTGLEVNGANVAIGYDRDDLITQVGGLTFARNPANGLVTGSTLGGVTTTQGYNGFGEMSSFSAKHGAATLYGLTLGRDALGRVNSRVETVAGVTTTYAYGFDLAGRLETVTQNGSPIATYGYDANGNRTKINGATIAAYDDQDRLAAYEGSSYTFTPSGSLSRKTTGTQSTQYAYDIFGNLKSVLLPDGTSIEYVADGRHRRVAKKVNGLLTQGFLYQDKLRVAAELSASGAVVARFNYATGGNVPEYMTRGGIDYRIIRDQVGSVRLVVNVQDGAIAQRIDYDEFGNVLFDTNPGFQPFGFAGGLYDRDTGLVRFGARDYDPAVGRWTARDPIGFSGGDSNLYAYVGSNPVTFTDPLGLAMWWNGSNSWTDVPDGPDWAPYEPGKDNNPQPGEGGGQATPNPTTSCPPAREPNSPSPPYNSEIAPPRWNLEHFVKMDGICLSFCIAREGFWFGVKAVGLLALKGAGVISSGTREVAEVASAGKSGYGVGSCVVNCMRDDIRFK